MNFEAEIKATLNTQDAKDTYDTFKRTIEADAIKVKLDVDFIGNNLLSSIINFCKIFVFKDI